MRNSRTAIGSIGLCLVLSLSFLACSGSSDERLASDHFHGLWLGDGMEEIRSAVPDKEGWSITDSSDNILITHTDGREQVEINLDGDKATIIAHDWFFEGAEEPAAIRRYDSLLTSITSIYGPPHQVDAAPNSDMKSCVWKVERGAQSYRVELGGVCGIQNAGWEQGGFCKVTVGVVDSR